MGDWGRGFLASCAGAAFGMAVTAFVMAGLKDPAHRWAPGSDARDGIYFTAGIVALLALPATPVGWICLRELPARMQNAFGAALVGIVLGPATLFALLLWTVLSEGWHGGDGLVWLLVASGVCGGCAALCAWLAGWRRAIRG